MYELDYLYSQLQLQTVKESYMSALNEMTESSYDVEEAKVEMQDTMKSIKNASEKCEAKLFDKRRKGIYTAKQLLGKFKATAQKSKPYGLLHREFKTFKTDEDIKRLHENAIKYLNQFNPRTASDTEVKLFISDIGDNVQYKALSTIFGETGDPKKSVKDYVVTNKESKEVTKENISEAIAYLESFDEDMSKYAIRRESFDDYGLSNERKIAARYKAALEAVADQKYYDMMSQKLTLEFAQASQILTKAAYHNPRNLRESKEVQDYIDFLYEYTV